MKADGDLGYGIAADLSSARMVLIYLGVSFGGRSPVLPRGRELKSLCSFSRMIMSFIMRENAL